MIHTHVHTCSRAYIYTLKGYQIWSSSHWWSSLLWSRIACAKGKTKSRDQCPRPSLWCQWPGGAQLQTFHRCPLWLSGADQLWNTALWQFILSFSDLVVSSFSYLFSLHLVLPIFTFLFFSFLFKHMFYFIVVRLIEQDEGSQGLQGIVMSDLHHLHF